MKQFEFEAITDDSQARAAIESHLHRSLLVEAAAGTGKTTQLIARLVALIRTGPARIDQIVAVTFTRKAAGELQLRLRLELEKARLRAASAEERGRLEDAVARLEEARIGTIHGFCAEILRERPVEAGVDPDFGELSEDQSFRLFDRAFRGWIQAQLDQMPEALSRALNRVALWQSAVGENSPLDRLRTAGWQLTEWRDFTAPWQKRPFDRAALIDSLVESGRQLAEVAALCQVTGDSLRAALEPVRLFDSTLRRAESIRPRDYDQLEASLLELLRQLKRLKRTGAGKFAEGFSRQQVKDLRESFLAELEAFQEAANADLAASLQQELRGLIDGYEHLKAQNGVLDFVDLLVRVRDLLRNNREVREHLQSRFRHVFIDEFQDTDPLQTEVLLLLCADEPSESDWRRIKVVPGKLFAVGDPKQSIYRFRRADILLYQEAKSILQNAAVQLVELKRNFRSVKPIQGAVNAAFENQIRRDENAGQPAYVPLEEFTPAIENQPALIALPVPEPFGYYGVTHFKVQEGEPDVIGGFIEWLLKSHWQVRDPENDFRLSRIQPRHICLLFRRFVSWGKDVTRPYVRALETRQIPHLLVGSRTFHQREEVESIRAALTAIEWPEDELAVFATLRGSLFSIPDSSLFRFRKTQGRLHPFRDLPEDLPEDLSTIKSILQFLAELHRRRNSRTAVETLNLLLEHTRAHASFALRPAGDQVLGNVLRICDLARQYESSGGLSFRGFVEYLIDKAGRSDTAEGPVLEEAAEGVRLMTLHSAKGLEFPIVILADLTCNLSHSSPDKFVDLQKNLSAVRLLGCSPWDLIENSELESKRDEAEGIRIAYVAATRARDMLVMPTVGQEEIRGWMEPLNDAFYPTDSSRTNPGSRSWCPPFGERTVLQEHPRPERILVPQVKPGSHKPRSGTHEVIWWDPAALNLNVEPDFGIRRQQILAPDPTNQAHQKGAEKYREWRETREDAIVDGSRPGLRLISPSDPSSAVPPDFRPIIHWESLPKSTQRPSGARFGTLVHTTLRDVGLRPDEEHIAHICRHHGRALGSTPEEVESAIEVVGACLRHPLLLRAAGAERCCRELPLTLTIGTGERLEGTADLAFLEKGRWVVVDFKTDADSELRKQHYERQLGWYLYAVETVTGKSSEGWLLSI